ncbi:MAG: hypothetical protein KC502_22980, partial [Myxococcales bacterium]|nr:hypothetical protein [Myxococcales bacterium]
MQDDITTVRTDEQLPRQMAITLGIASVGLGVWEVGLTRLASLLYTRTLAYQALSIALLLMGLGAWWAARRGGGSLRLIRMGLASLAPIVLLSAVLCTRYDVAWAAAAFAWPFFVFGAVLAGAWRISSKGGEAARRRQYRWELAGFALGLAVIGPALMAWRSSFVTAGAAGLLCAIASMYANRHLRTHPSGDDSHRDSRPGRGTRAVAWLGLVVSIVGLGAAWRGVDPVP